MDSSWYLQNQLPKKTTIKIIELQIHLIVDEIILTSKPQIVYLTGSASGKKYAEYSDFYLVVIARDESQKNVLKSDVPVTRTLKQISIDFIVFDQKKFNGGIAFEVFKIE